MPRRAPSAVPPALAHRGGLAVRVPALRPPQDLFERVGGRGVVRTLVRALYRGIEHDPELRPLFRKNLEPGIVGSEEFFEEWLGGEARWNTYRGLAARHSMRITADQARRWLGHLEAALEEARIGDAERAELLQVARPIAMALVSEDTVDGSISLACPHTYTDAARAAGRGDREAVLALLDTEPRFAHPGGVGLQLLLFHAARRGRTELVAELLDRGADVDLPDSSDTPFPVSAYAAARARKQHETADYLLERGATVDVFSAAYTGELERLVACLEDDPDLVNAVDPARDYAEITPLHHAIEARELAAVRTLLERGASVGPQGHERLAQALEHDPPVALELARLLLDHGATARGLEPDTWILDPGLAQLLFAHGADFRTASPEWIEHCTGHHGNRENPDLIRAFLAHGVPVDARAPKQRTALHCATRVGYTGIMQALLDAGADIEARDASGDTPLAYVLQARKRVDLHATARVLLDAGADPLAENDEGESVLARLKRARKPELVALAAELGE